MTERPQSLIRRTRERITPVLAIPLVAGVALDIWSHPNANTKQEFWSHLFEGNKADIARRKIIESIPEIGPTIAVHIGNFGNSAAMMIPFTYAGYKIKEYGKSKESKIIETIGDLTPLAGFLAIVTINVIAENMNPNNPQKGGDLLFGLAGALLAHTVTQGALERVQTKSNDRSNGVVS